MLKPIFLLSLSLSWGITIFAMEAEKDDIRHEARDRNFVEHKIKCSKPEIIISFSVDFLVDNCNIYYFDISLDKLEKYDHTPSYLVSHRYSNTERFCFSMPEPSIKKFSKTQIFNEEKPGKGINIILLVPKDLEISIEGKIYL
jgi:hypothetical protein